MAAGLLSSNPKTIFRASGRWRWLSLAQLVRTPSHSRRAEAARRAARHVLWLSAGSRRCDHRADVRDRRVGNRPDAEARHAIAVVAAHSHRFRQGRICAGGAGRIADRGGDRLAGACAASSARCCLVSERGCSSCSSPCCVQSGHRSAEILRRPRPAVCRRRGQRVPFLALRGQPGLFQLSFRPRHRPPLRLLSPCPRYGRRRASRWPSMP